MKEFGRRKADPDQGGCGSKAAVAVVAQPGGALGSLQVPQAGTAASSAVPSIHSALFQAKDAVEHLPQTA